MHQPWNSNAYGISLGGGTQKDITITENLFYNLMKRSLLVKAQTDWSNIKVTKNRFADPGLDACLIEHSGDFTKVSYADNSYSGQPDQDWFCGDVTGDITTWTAASGETGATKFTPAFTDPNRTAGTYAETLGLDPTLEAFLRAARLQTRLNWNPAYTAKKINNYIRTGFEQ
ncbi:MAG: hypothetical protein JXR91_12330 [Deltaproteobacteria bacterium]|nr:hypothetical protein [Deltaproteobacteria bacterium]